MGVTKVTIIDSPEKMRSQSTGYSIIIPQVREEPSMKKDTKTEETAKTK
ncbi:hypothetical protein N9Y91_02685 [Alphaproteobacteria bacterium]|nr:hypothetical protein [Alphaproteobacteria bacterium]